MKKTKIEVMHQIEKTKYVFFVNDQDKLNNFEVETIKTEMGVSMVFVNGKLYK